MELKTYFDVLRRQFWVVLLTLGIAVSATSVGTYFLEPQYTATAELRLATATAGDASWVNYDIDYADRQMNTFVRLAQTKRLRDRLSERLELEALPKMTVEKVPNTELLAITVHSADPQLATTTANTYAGILIAASNETLETDDSALATQLNALSVRLATLESDGDAEQLANSRAIYSELLREYELGRIRDQLRGSRMTLVDQAAVPERAIFPNWPLNIALGVLLGSLAGVTLAFVYDTLNSKLNSASEVARIAQLPTLAEIPPISQEIDHTMIGIPQVEAFRRLYTNLIATHDGNPPKTIIVTSAEKNEGKSTIVANLALALSNARRSVLIIDANIRSPQMGKMLGVQGEYGLSDVILRGFNLLKHAMRPALQGNVQVLTAGSVKSSRFLYDPRMETLLDALRDKFDVILIDTPAMLHYSDALAMLPHVDGALLVVNRDISDRETLVAVQTQLSTLKARPLGIVVNETDGAHRKRSKRTVSAELVGLL